MVSRTAKSCHRFALETGPERAARTMLASARSPPPVDHEVPVTLLSRASPAFVACPDPAGRFARRLRERDIGHAHAPTRRRHDPGIGQTGGRLGEQCRNCACAAPGRRPGRCQVRPGGTNPGHRRSVAGSRRQAGLCISHDTGPRRLAREGAEPWLAAFRRSGQGRHAYRRPVHPVAEGRQGLSRAHARGLRPAVLPVAQDQDRDRRGTLVRRPHGQ